MPLMPIPIRPDTVQGRRLAQSFGDAAADGCVGNSAAACEKNLDFITAGDTPERLENFAVLLNQREVPPEWESFALALRQGQGGAELFVSAGPSACNPPPLPAHLFRAWVHVLPCALAAQRSAWRASVASFGRAHPDPSITASRLAGMCRFLGHADTRDVASFLHLIAEFVKELSGLGVALTDQALAKLGMGLGRTRATEHSAEVGDAARRLLNEMACHLDPTRKPTAYILAGLMAGLRNQFALEAVRPYLKKLGALFAALPDDVRLGSLFVQTALPGLALLPPCATIESIFGSINLHLERALKPLARDDVTTVSKRFFFSSAVVELLRHLEQDAGRALALAIIRHTDVNTRLPQDGFLNRQKTDEWLCNCLSIPRSASEGKLDLHGQSHRLAAFCVNGVIDHALHALPGKNSLEIVFGAATHCRANEGVMRAVAEQVIGQKREVHGEKIGGVRYDGASLTVVVSGRRGSSVSPCGASGVASPTPSPRQSNRFDLLVEGASDERESIGLHKADSKKKKKRRSPSAASAEIGSVDARAAPNGSTTPVARERRRAAAPKSRVSAGGWLDWLRGWFWRSA